MNEHLPPLPEESISRVLCVVAHPDDVEYGTSSAVAAWTSRAIEVAYLLLTRGEAGMDASPPDETAKLRVAEQIGASELVGVTDVEFLDYPDGVLEYSLGMRRDIARAIRRHRPDAVIAGTWEVDFVAGLNQADHRVVGLATLDAIRDAANRWVFPELVAEGLEPHSVRWLLIAGDSNPTHGVDVTGDPLEKGDRLPRGPRAVSGGYRRPSSAPADAHRDHPSSGKGHGSGPCRAVPGRRLPVAAAAGGQDDGGYAGASTADYMRGAGDGDEAQPTARQPLGTRPVAIG
ncbi:hypothetical protein BH23ACT5_BH23ACT5_16000 [soil metagenome]